MKTMFKVLVKFIMISSTYILHAQDSHFSQFDKSPLMINPALAGALYKTQVNLNYRSQWSSVNSPFKTFGFSADQRFGGGRKQNGFFGVGLYALSDNASSKTITTMDLKLSVSGHIRINKQSSIGLGIQAGMLQRSLTTSNFQWGSQYNGNAYDPTISNAEGTSASYNSISVFDVSSGIVYSYNSNEYQKVTGNNDKFLNFGVSFYHLNKPSYSFQGGNEKLPIKITAFANSLFNIQNTNVAVGPSFLYQRQSNASELLIGSRVRYMIGNASKVTNFKSASAVSMGCYLRYKDAIVTLFQYEIKNYLVGFSYDINVSKLRSYSNLRGGFELSLRFVAPTPYGGNSRSRI